MHRRTIARPVLTTVAVSAAVTVGSLAAGPSVLASPATSGLEGHPMATAQSSTADVLDPGILGPDAYGVLLAAVETTSPKQAWAVGYTGDGSTDSTPIAEHWNGTTWSLTKPVSVKGAESTALYGVTEISAKDVWAVGSYSIDGVGTFLVTEHWNGSKWSLVSSPNPPGSDTSGFDAVSATSADDVWAVGLTYDPGTFGYVTLAEHWNGKKWSEAQTVNPGGTSWAPLRGVTSISLKDVWTVGEYQPGNYDTLGEHWDGKAWSDGDTANPKQAVVSSLYAVSADASNDVWATGCWSMEKLFCGSPGSPQKPLAERWNGTSWKIAPVAVPHGQIYAGFTGVATQSANDAWAVGTASTDSTAKPLVEHWDGKAWSEAASPKLHGTPYLAAVDTSSAKDAWLVGATDKGTLAEHWDGKTWTVVTTPNP